MTYSSAHAIFADVLDERQRQKNIWGENGKGHSPLIWSTILSEEVGEVAQAALQIHFDKSDKESLEAFRSELIQAAAVCVAALEEIYDKKDKK